MNRGESEDQQPVQPLDHRFAITLRTTSPFSACRLAKRAAFGMIFEEKQWSSPLDSRW